MPVTLLFSPLIFVVIIIYGFVFLLALGGIYFFQGKTALEQIFQVSTSLFKIIELGLGSGLAVIFISIIAARLFHFVRVLEKEFQTILGKLSWLEIIIIALVSGIAEEFFFRGAIQPLLGLTATSFLFALLHFPINRKYLPWTIFALGMGFLLGWLYQETQTLLTPIITHTVVNLVNLGRICYQN